MKLKNTYLIVPASIIIAFITLSWGAVGHTKISQDAPLSFIQEMSQFNTWISYLVAHSSDADTANPKTKHYIDIDAYPVFVSTGRIPQTIDSMNAIYGASNVNSNGLLPWATKTDVDSLKSCLQRNDWNKALDFASELVHYVGDGHNPLHITENYDGAQTGNSGIHSRYESTMISQYVSQINYTGDTVIEIQDVNQYIFNYLYANYKYKDSILLADTYAKTINSNTSSSQYKDALWQRTKTFTILLFKNASHAIAELLYTAWKQAGSPLISGTSITPIVASNNLLQLQNSPNPFRNSTQITYFLPKRTQVELRVYDASGKQIELFKNETETSGKHQTEWNTQSLPTGLYYLNLKTSETSQSIKIVKSE
ncbi:MAG: T9SS type A sorting domain-containing protein [Bacteroidota bacterium]